MGKWGIIRWSSRDNVGRSKCARKNRRRAEKVERWDNQMEHRDMEFPSGPISKVSMARLIDILSFPQKERGELKKGSDRCKMVKMVKNGRLNNGRLNN